jgi:hypothetical protein
MIVGTEARSSTIKAGKSKTKASMSGSARKTNAIGVLRLRGYRTVWLQLLRATMKTVPSIPQNLTRR